MRQIPVHRLGFWSLLALIVAGVSLALPRVVPASVASARTVCPDGPPTCDYATIPGALSGGSDGDRILIAPGTYDGGFTIDKSVRLIGSGASQTQISGGDPAVVAISSGQTVVIRDLTITGATGTGVVNDGTLTLRESTVSDNTFSAESGAGGVLNNGTLTLNDSSVSDNYVQTALKIEGAAGIVNHGAATLDDSTVSGNHAYSATVGGILNSGQLVLRNCTIGSNNSGDYDDAGGMVNSGDAVIADTTIVNNGTRGGVGGIGNRGTLRLTRSVLADNFGWAGPGAIVNSGEVTIEDSDVRGNSTYHGVQAISNQGAMSLRRTTVSGHHQGGYVPIENSGSLTLRESTVSGNRASNTGGIYNTGTLTLRESTVSGNSAAGLSFGGGIDNRGDTLLVSSAVSDNTALRGGGIANERGSLTLNHSLVTRNTARGYTGVFGGGIYNRPGALIAVRHSTISGNTPDDCVGC